MDEGASWATVQGSWRVGHDWASTTTWAWCTSLCWLRSFEVSSTTSIGPDLQYLHYHKTRLSASGPGLWSEVNTSLLWRICWLFFVLRQIHSNRYLFPQLGSLFWRSYFLWGRIWDVFLKRVSVPGKGAYLHSGRGDPQPYIPYWILFWLESSFCSFGSKSVSFFSETKI